jgi:hypothetical protein
MNKLILASFIFIFVTFTSCKSSDDEEINPLEGKYQCLVRAKMSDALLLNVFGEKRKEFIDLSSYYIQVGDKYNYNGYKRYQALNSDTDCSRLLKSIEPFATFDYTNNMPTHDGIPTHTYYVQLFNKQASFPSDMYPVKEITMTFKVKKGSTIVYTIQDTSTATITCQD